MLIFFTTSDRRTESASSSIHAPFAFVVTGIIKQTQIVTCRADRLVAQIVVWLTQIHIAAGLEYTRPTGHGLCS